MWKKRWIILEFISGGSIYTGFDLKCNYTTVNGIVGKIKEHIKIFSFLPINNCFTHLSFDEYPRSIYGRAPAKILHAVLFELCEYIAESLELKSILSTTIMISHAVVGYIRIHDIRVVVIF